MSENLELVKKPSFQTLPKIGIKKKRGAIIFF